MEELKKKNKLLACVIIVLVCLVVGLLVTVIRNNKQEGNSINDESKVEEPTTNTEESEENTIPNVEDNIIPEIEANNDENIPENYRMQIITKTINGKEHTLRLDANKEFNKKIDIGFGNTITSDVVSYKLYLDNRIIKDTIGEQEWYNNESPEDFIIKFNDSNIKIVNSVEGKEYLVLSINQASYGESQPNMYVINDSGKLLGKIEYIEGASIGKLEGDNAKNYEKYSSCVLLNNSIKVLVADEVVGEHDSNWFTEKTITIENDKLVVKDTGRYFGSDFDGPTISPSWKITTY